MLKKFDRTKYDALLYRDFSVHYGKVNKVVGLTVESVGPPAKLNDLCEIISKDGQTKVMAEVVGFRENKVLLMPYDLVDGIGLGATVRNTEGVLQVPVGEELLGKVLDGIGRPMDGSTLTTTKTYPIDAPPPDPLKRKLIGAAARRKSGGWTFDDRERTAYRYFRR